MRIVQITPGSGDSFYCENCVRDAALVMAMRMTSARNLGRMTISMLRAEQGRHVQELHRLVNWLDTRQNRPDVVCLSNILLAGLAKPIKERLHVPVVCLLQDEDGFLDGLIRRKADSTGLADDCGALRRSGCIRQQLASCGFIDDVDFLPDFDRDVEQTAQEMVRIYEGIT